MKIRRILGSSALALGLLVPPGTAVAAPPPPPSPIPEPFELAGTATAGVNGYCLFPVLVTVNRNKERTRTVTLPDGTSMYKTTGAFVVTLANETSGKSVTYNAPGNGIVTVYPDGAFALDEQGPNVLFTTVANSFPGVPPITFTTGRVNVQVDNRGLTTKWSGTGPVTDVCAALTT